MVLRWLVTDVLLPLKKQLVTKGCYKLTSQSVPTYSSSSCSTSQVANAHFSHLHRFHHHHHLSQLYQQRLQRLKNGHGKRQSFRALSMGFSPFMLHAQRQTCSCILNSLRQRLLRFAGQYAWAAENAARQRVELHSSAWAKWHKHKHGHHGAHHFGLCLFGRQGGPSVGGRIFPELGKAHMYPQAPRSYVTFVGHCQQPARAAATTLFRTGTSPFAALCGNHTQLPVCFDSIEREDKMCKIRQKQRACPSSYRKYVNSSRKIMAQSSRFNKKSSKLSTTIHPEPTRYPYDAKQTTPVMATAITTDEVATLIVEMAPDTTVSPQSATIPTVAQKLEMTQPTETLLLPTTVPPCEPRQVEKPDSESMVATLLVNDVVSNGNKGGSDGEHRSDISSSNETRPKETKSELTFNNDYYVTFLLPGPPLYDHLAENNNTVDYIFLENLSKAADQSRHHLDLISLALRILRERTLRLEVRVDGFEMRVFVPANLSASTIRLWLCEIGLREGNHYLLDKRSNTCTSVSTAPHSTLRNDSLPNHQHHALSPTSTEPSSSDGSSTRWTPSWTRWEPDPKRNASRGVSAREIHNFLTEVDELIRQSATFATSRSVRDTDNNCNNSSARSLETRLDAARSYSASMEEVCSF